MLQRRLKSELKSMKTWTSSEKSLTKTSTAFKKQIGEIEESLQSTQVDIESLRNEVKNVSATSTGSFEELNKRILYFVQLKLAQTGNRKEHAIRAVYET